MPDNRETPTPPAGAGHADGADEPRLDPNRPAEGLREDRSFQQGLKPTEPGGEMEHQDPAHMNDLDRVQGNDRGAMEAEGGAGSTYDPSSTEATRARMQGGGVGRKELDAQRDPTRADSTEHYGATGDAGPGGKHDSGGDIEHGGEGRGGSDVERGLGGGRGTERP